MNPSVNNNAWDLSGKQSIEQFLDRVDAVLLQDKTSRRERTTILGELESQIYAMIASRTDDNPTRINQEIVEQVLETLDPPDHYRLSPPESNRLESLSSIPLPLDQTSTTSLDLSHSNPTNSLNYSSFEQVTLGASPSENLTEHTPKGPDKTNHSSAESLHEFNATPEPQMESHAEPLRSGILSMFFEKTKNALKHCLRGSNDLRRLVTEFIKGPVSRAFQWWKNYRATPHIEPLAILSAAVLAIAILVMPFFFRAPLFFLSLLVASFIAGAVSLMRIKRQPEQRRGKILAQIGIIGLPFFIGNALIIALCFHPPIAMSLLGAGLCLANVILLRMVGLYIYSSTHGVSNKDESAVQADKENSRSVDVPACPPPMPV